MSIITDNQLGQLIRSYGWNGNATNTPLDITYSFGAGVVPYWQPSDYGIHGVKEETVAPLLGTQKTAFADAVKVWENVANIHLTLGTPHNGFGDIVVVGAELFDPFDPENPNIIIDGSTISPTSTRSADSAGDIVFGNTGQANTNNNLLVPGQIGFNTFVHELGHALGLDHPLHGDGYALNQLLTTMSYNVMDGLTGNGHDPHKITLDGTPNGSQWYPAKPMLYDILAIQTLYGVNTTDPIVNNVGGDAYKFKTGADAVQAIWDNGGSDAIDANEQTDTVTIDLRPGHFSFVGQDENSSQQLISIAYQVAGQENNWIENAIGGSARDVLIGNDGNNVLSGNSVVLTGLNDYTNFGGVTVNGINDAYGDFLSSGKGRYG